MIDTYTISDVFDLRWTREGTRVAIREGEREVTFRDLLHWSQAISRALEPVLGTPGQRVALLLPNSAAFVAAFFAITRIGGVVAPLGSRYRAQELAYYLKDLEAVALVTESAFLERVSQILPRLEIPPTIFEVSVGLGARQVRSGGGRGQPISSSPSTPLLQQSTSGFSFSFPGTRQSCCLRGVPSVTPFLMAGSWPRPQRPFRPSGSLCSSGRQLSSRSRDFSSRGSH